MALDNDSVGEGLFSARTPSGVSGSAEGLALAKREASALAPMMTITVGTEAGDVIELSCQLEDGEGNAIAEVATVLVSLFDANMIASLAAAFSMADGGAGALVSATAQAQCLATTDATGLLEVDVTDVVGASGATIYAIVTILDAAGIATQADVTFD